MILKDISIESEFAELNGAVFQDSTLNHAKSDVFLLVDFHENIGKSIQLQSNSDGETFAGKLESVKIDIDALTNPNSGSVLYLIKLEGYNSDFQINADSIEYNKNYLKKYYFKLDDHITWRIVFY